MPTAADPDAQLSTRRGGAVAGETASAMPGAMSDPGMVPALKEEEGVCACGMKGLHVCKLLAEVPLIRALLDIRIAIERVGYDRSLSDAASFAMTRAIGAMTAAGYDPFAGYPLRRHHDAPAPPTSPASADATEEPAK